MIDYNSFENDIKGLMLFNEVIMKPCQHDTLSRLPVMSFRTLCVLMTFDGCGLNDLAKYLNVSKQQVSVVVKRLEEENYIHTSRDENDKRKICVYINEDARKMIDDSMNCYVGELTKLMKNSSSIKQKKLIDMVHQLKLCIEDCKEDL